MEVGKICPEHGINPDTGRCKKGERNGRGQCVMNENGRCVKIQAAKKSSSGLNRAARKIQALQRGLMARNSRRKHLRSVKQTHKQHKELYKNVSEDGIVRIEYLVSDIDNLLNFVLDDEEKYQKVVNLWGPTMPREYLLTMSEAKQISKLDEKQGRGVMLGQTWKHVEMLHKNHFLFMDSADNDENHVGLIFNSGGLAVTGSGSDVIIRVDDKLLQYAKSLTPVVKKMLDKEEKLDAKLQAAKMKEWLNANKYAEQLTKDCLKMKQIARDIGIDVDGLYEISEDLRTKIGLRSSGRDARVIGQSWFESSVAPLDFQDEVYPVWKEELVHDSLNTGNPERLKRLIREAKETRVLLEEARSDQKLLKSKTGKKTSKSKKIVSKAKKSLKKEKKDKKDKKEKLDGCVPSTDKKYASRNGPPYPANKCCGAELLGNDGLMYRSVANKKGVCSWKKIKADKGPLRGVDKISYDQWLEAMKTGIAIVDKRLEKEERGEKAGKLDETERKALETMLDLADRVRKENGWEEVDNAADAEHYGDWWTLDKTLEALGWQYLESNDEAWDKGWESVDRAETMLRYY